MSEAIYFYLANGNYGCFSNFSSHAIYLDSKRWPTSEHYFQAKKFEGTEHEELIRMAAKPKDAAEMGRSRQRPLRSDWEEIKDDVMRKAVLAKFTIHEKLKWTLLGTGDAHLIEHTANDSYWADGGDGTGQNKLGLILMEVRAAIREGREVFEAGQYC